MSHGPRDPSTALVPIQSNTGNYTRNQPQSTCGTLLAELDLSLPKGRSNPKTRRAGQVSSRRSPRLAVRALTGFVVLRCCRYDRRQRGVLLSNSGHHKANLPVANATVNARWSGLVTGTGSGKTDANGQVTLTSKSTSKRGTVKITVTGVTPPAGSVYDSTMNLKTSASIAL